MEYGQVEFFDNRPSKMLGYMTSEAGDKVFFLLKNGVRPAAKGSSPWYEPGTSPSRTPQVGDWLAYDLRTLDYYHPEGHLETLRWAYKDEFELVQNGDKLAFTLDEAHAHLAHIPFDGVLDGKWVEGTSEFGEQSYDPMTNYTVTVYETATRARTTFCRSQAEGFAYARHNPSALDVLEQVRIEEILTFTQKDWRTERRAHRNMFRVMRSKISFLTPTEEDEVEYHYVDDFATFEEAVIYCCKKEEAMYDIRYTVFDQRGHKVFSAPYYASR